MSVKTLGERDSFLTAMGFRTANVLYLEFPYDNSEDANTHLDTLLAEQNIVNSEYQTVGVGCDTDSSQCIAFFV